MHTNIDVKFLLALLTIAKYQNFNIKHITSFISFQFRHWVECVLHCECTCIRLHIRSSPWNKWADQWRVTLIISLLFSTKWKLSQSYAIGDLPCLSAVSSLSYLVSVAFSAIPLSLPSVPAFLSFSFSRPAPYAPLLCNTYTHAIFLSSGNSATLSIRGNCKTAARILSARPQRLSFRRDQGKRRISLGFDPRRKLVTDERISPFNGTGRTI